MNRRVIVAGVVAALVGVMVIAGIVSAGNNGVVDHYLFYKAKAKVKVNVNLDDQFIPATDFKVKDLKALGVPTNKTTVGYGYAEIQHDAHLTSYKIKRAKKKGPKVDPKVTVSVTDQFGTMNILVRKLDRLLVPATKGDNGTIEPPDVDGLKLDHYTCYKVKLLGGFDEISGVIVSDQFTINKEIVVKKPKRLCAPVVKDHNGDVFEIQNADNTTRNHLMCYKIKLADGVEKNTKDKSKWVADQFFPDSIKLGKKLKTDKPKELCVPAQKTVLP